MPKWTQRCKPIGTQDESDWLTPIETMDENKDDNSYKRTKKMDKKHDEGRKKKGEGTLCAWNRARDTSTQMKRNGISDVGHPRMIISV